MDICLAEAEELVFARDRITCALADRVGRVHRAGQARRHGHASTRSWLRTAAGMTVAGAGRLLSLGIELARLPKVREKFAAGGLAAGVVEAICTAVAGLSDEQAAVAEPILLELAGKAGAAEVAKAGRYLRAVLDPDGEDRDERADYGRRFLRVRPGKGGGLEGEFYLPREHAARLQALLDAYARPKAEGDDRPLRVRQADAFMALLEEKIAAELLVLVNAESLPADPATGPESADHPETPEGTQGTEHTEGVRKTQDAEAAEESVSVVGAGADVAAEAAVESTAESAVESTVDSLNLATGSRDVQSGDDATGRVQAKSTQRSESQQEPQQSAPQRQESRSWESRWGEWRSPDPPGDTCAHHAHAGPRPAGDCRHAQATREDDGHEHQGHGQGACGCGCGCGSRARCSSTAPGAGPDRSGGPGGPRAETREAPGARGPEPGTPPGPEPGAPPGVLGPEPEASSGAEPGSPPGAEPGAAAGGLPGALLGTALGTAPGLLLATGQVLPVSSVHRLARTSTLVRIVMDADGQVLDMGRKVRLATPAQRRAIYARYATCWIDGCPLPATRCQIDHADNWSTGGLTDLKLLGPACQFHNRDRYQHPDRYTRRRVGTDRWAFTYHPARTRRVRI
ncbi:HNH endonuclease signature motif containing protein [Microbispora sp. H13382]|uniref:HNH endonuclease signature motif containing protein n=1 Tax=Microbispora sp. H13382 TaxID=2729112 RepID=UPI001C7276D9|nr:HNH endonuclease signature motif containing protein [Microbispora sp. H13382]